MTTKLKAGSFTAVTGTYSEESIDLGKPIKLKTISMDINMDVTSKRIWYMAAIGEHAAIESAGQSNYIFKKFCEYNHNVWNSIDFRCYDLEIIDGKLTVGVYQNRGSNATCTYRVLYEI